LARMRQRARRRRAAESEGIRQFSRMVPNNRRDVLDDLLRMPADTFELVRFFIERLAKDARDPSE
jgi:hypothetical protein